MTARSRTIAHRISIGIICIAILAYTIFHMVSLFSAELSTIVVRSTTEETKLEFDGYIFRDEFPVYSEYGGAVDYIAYDGLKLAAKEQIAVVYEQGNNANISLNIDELDSRIAVMEESLSKGISLSDLPVINDEIGDTYYSIIKSLADGDIRGISKNIDNMTAELGKVSVLTNEESLIPTTLQNLYNERERLMAAGGNSVSLTAEKSGYFYSKIDGYEEIFTLAAADGLTVDSYYKYASASAGTISKGQNAIGKMVYDSKWKFASVVSKAYAKHFEEGVSYSTSFTGGSTVSIPLKLERMEKDDDSSSVLLVFECDRMPSDFDFARVQSAYVTVESMTGINVPKSAVHKSNGKLYVYILKGSVVFERRLEVVHEGSDYYTVRDGVPADEGDTYLQSNDNLILDGQNLFDGRILE